MVIWRVHDKGGVLLSDGWNASFLVPATLIGAAVLGAGILNFMASRSPRKVDESSAIDLFADPHWKIVSDYTFTNESVEIDGKSFRDCSFVNATLLFHGTAPAEFPGCQFEGNIALTTDFKPTMLYLKLQRLITPSGKVSSTDQKGNKVPEVVAVPKSSLRERVFKASEELELLLQRHGKRPNPYLIPISDKAEYTRQYNETVQAWDNKFQADYWKHYKSKIVDLRHDLAIASLTSDPLDNKLNEAETAALSDGTVREIAMNLRLLAAKL
jgi:hypothetical protein